MSAVAVVAAAGALSWIAFALLGHRVGQDPPLAVDAVRRHLFGRGAIVAASLTATGYARFLAGASLLVALMALVRKQPLTPVLALVGLQLLSQAVVVAVKPHFRRGRPDRWLVRQDLGFSYPSGHACTAFVFYGGIFVAIAASAAPMPAKFVGCVVLGAWMLGICWSRVALGAHYASDVLGGALLGFGFLCAALAVAEHVGAPILGG